MKDFVGTVVGGAIGLAALYVVGKIAFQAGQDVARVECHYEQLQRAIKEKEAKKDISDGGKSEDLPNGEGVDIISDKKQNRLGMLFSLHKAFGKKGTSVVGDLIQNPESHVIEACVKGREIHVNVKPKTA